MGGLNGRFDSACVLSACTLTNSCSGQRSAVSAPPNTHPVSMQMHRFTHSGASAGVWPYTTLARAR